MAVDEIEIDYAPRTWADALHDCFKRWIVMVLHRRAGKTTAFLNHLQRAATDDEWERKRLEYVLEKMPDLTDRERKETIDELMRKRRPYAYILPTYKQAKNVAWQILKDISRDIPQIKTNEAELYVEYPNGNRITLYGAENVDALRGMALRGGGSDEDSQHPANLFGEVISKCLADGLGFWGFLGTPKGKTQFYRRYNIARKDPNWLSIYRTIDQSLKAEKGATIIALRQSLEDDKLLVKQGAMTQEEFDQEWYCSFEAAIRGAVYSKELSAARNSGRIKRCHWNPAFPCFDVWDLGKGKNMAVGVYQRIAGQPVMIDYLEGDGMDGIPQVIKKLKEKPYIYAKHFAPHDIEAPDLGTGLTRRETAKNLGWEFDVIPNISLQDGLNAGKLFFARLYINEPTYEEEQRGEFFCLPWLNAVALYHFEWDEKKNDYKPEPVHDWTSHPSDVHRYAAIVEEQMVGVAPILPAPQLNTMENRQYRGTVNPIDEEEAEEAKPFHGMKVGQMGHGPAPGTPEDVKPAPKPIRGREV